MRMCLKLQRGGRALRGEDSVQTPGPGWLWGLGHGRETGGSSPACPTWTGEEGTSSWVAFLPPLAWSPDSRCPLPQQPLGRPRAARGSPSWPLSWSHAKATWVLLVLWGRWAAPKHASGRASLWGPFMRQATVLFTAPRACSRISSSLSCHCRSWPQGPRSVHCPACPEEQILGVHGGVGSHKPGSPGSGFVGTRLGGVEGWERAAVASLCRQVAGPPGEGV